jgi:ribonuclease HI
MAKHRATTIDFKFWPVNGKSTDFFISETEPHYDKTIYLHFDGLYRKNSPKTGLRDAEAGYCGCGLVTYGWMIIKYPRIAAHGLGAHKNFIGATSNAGEYFGLIHGLEALLDMGFEHKKIVVRGDSKTVIEQMQHQARVSSPAILPVYDHAQSLAGHFAGLRWQWIPRKYNSASDQLARKALKQYRMFASQNILDKYYQKNMTIVEECENPLFDLNVFNTQIEYAM